MTTDLQPIVAPPTVTADQLDLITRTVAAGATPDELKLYLFDCARQGVHPLDKLVHFTKRQGKYTPITSIDFMRIRAAETGEYAGSDDAVFTLGDERLKAPDTATVKVWRLVQGQRCPFTATARWDEYCPEPGPSGKGDIMWRKMPHTMLAKCAEALALRKGFPRQLAGLYAGEELDQAGTGSRAPDPPAVISEPQRKKLFAVAKEHGWTTDRLKPWLQQRGIESTKGIPLDQYDALLEALARAGPATAVAATLGEPRPVTAKDIWPSR